MLTLPFFSEPMSPMIYCSCFLLLPLFSNVFSTASTVASKDWLIEFRQPVSAEAARRIAKRYAMVSRGPVIKDERLYHFVDLKPTHPHKRKRRDVEQEEFIERHQWVSCSMNFTASTQCSRPGETRHSSNPSRSCQTRVSTTERSLFQISMVFSKWHSLDDDNERRIVWSFLFPRKMLDKREANLVLIWMSKRPGRSGIPEKTSPRQLWMMELITRIPTWCITMFVEHFPREKQTFCVFHRLSSERCCKLRFQ